MQTLWLIHALLRAVSSLLSLVCSMLQAFLFALVRGQHFCGPLYLAALVPSRRLKSTRCGIFWEIPSGVVSTFSAYWLDRGHMFVSVYEVLGNFTHFYVNVISSTHSANCAVFCLDKGVDMHVVVRKGVFGFSVRSLLPSPMRKWPRSSLTTVVWLVLQVPVHLALSLRQWQVQGCSRISRCVPFAFRQAQDLRHLDGYGLEGQRFVHKPVESPRVQFLDE